MSNANDIQSGLDALRRPPEDTRPLSEAPPAAPIPAVVARATSIPPKTGGGTAGIASPLTELALNSRTYHADKSVMSSDGIFVVKLKPVASLQMTDATGAPVVFMFNNPA